LCIALNGYQWATGAGSIGLLTARQTHDGVCARLGWGCLSYGVSARKTTQQVRSDPYNKPMSWPESHFTRPQIQLLRRFS